MVEGLTLARGGCTAESALLSSLSDMVRLEGLGELQSAGQRGGVTTTAAPFPYLTT